MRPATTSTRVDFSPALSGLRVLLVDDDPGARELLTTVLSQCGVEVTAVESAAQGLAAVKRLKPDVLLSDLEMPDEDGYSLIRQVRSLDLDEGGGVPAAALTAYTRPQDRKRALLAGFQVHISKPVEPDELTAAIASLAGRTLVAH